MKLGKFWYRLMTADLIAGAFLLYAGLALAVVGNWAYAFATVDGQRYAVQYTIQRAPCEDFPKLAVCAAGAPFPYRAAVIVYKRADNEPAGERYGAAGSVSPEVARTYIDCPNVACGRDKPESWVRTALYDAARPR